ncbi:MAG: hypothetical protein KF850_15175 [Labilithrix sp.]|nr:hypothetical protein [Labilithrix sp.]
MRRGYGRRAARQRPTRLTAASVLVGLALGATSSTFARAGELAGGAGGVAATVEPSSRRLVAVKIAGDAVPVAAVLDVLRERVSGTETTFEVVPAIDRASIVTPGATDDRQLARIWIDLSEPPGHANEQAPMTLYVVDGAWERVLVRPVARQANPEVAWEEIGHIVELALGALRAGERIGVGRAVAREQLLPSVAPAAPPPPASPDAPVTAPPPKTNQRPARFRAGGFYGVNAYGHGLELASGPGLMFELQRERGRFALGGTLMGEYRFPSEVDRGIVTVRFEGGAVHAMATGSYELAPRHHVLLGVGGGAELAQVRGSSNTLDNVRFVDGDADLVPTARVLARYAYTIAKPSLRVFAGLGMDVPLRNPRYLLSRGNDAVVLFEPWGARPLFLLGIQTN